MLSYINAGIKTTFSHTINVFVFQMTVFFFSCSFSICGLLTNRKYEGECIQHRVNRTSKKYRVGVGTRTYITRGVDDLIDWDIISPKSNNSIYKRERSIGKGIKGGIISSKEGLDEGLLCDISIVTFVGVFHQTFQTLTPIWSNSAIWTFCENSHLLRA